METHDSVRFVAKAVVAAALVWALVLPLVLLLWLPLGLALAAVLWVGAIFVPWSRFRRSEWLRGRDLRRATRRRQLQAVLVVLAGVALCITSDYWFGTHASNGLGRQVIGVRWDLVLALPFALLAALLLLTGMSGVAAVVAAGLLSYICVTSYDAVTAGDNSTAAVGYTYPWMLGIPLIALCYVVDAAARGMVASRRNAERL